MSKPASRRLAPPLRLSLTVLALVAAALAITAFSRAIAGAQGSDTSIDGDVAAGRDLYGQACALCHGETLRGVVADDGTVTGPPLLTVGTASVDFMLRTGRMPLSEPGAPLERKVPQITETQRNDLLAYLVTQMTGGPDIPELETGTESLSRGRESFTSNCAACHGPTAAGIAVGQRDIAPNLKSAAPLEIAEAVRTGPGRMPVFGEELLPADEVNDIVAWVIDLRDRAAPGGAQLGRSGPVSEGFVAWFLGMGMLGIVMYLLGQKERSEDLPTALDDPTLGDTDGEQHG